MRSRCRQALKDEGLAGGTIETYVGSLLHLITYMESKGLSEYTKNVGDSFLDFTLHNSAMSCGARNAFHKVVRVLNYIIGLEPTPVNYAYKRIEYQYPDEYKPIVEKFIAYYSELGRKDGTIAHYEYHTSLFTVFLSLKGIHPNEVCRENVVEFFNNRGETQPSGCVTSVKYFCIFLHHEGYIADNFESFFRRYKQYKKQKLLSYYTPEEIAKIEAVIDRSTIIGRRNYAMVLLASRLGLRSSDVRNLKFEDIDWEKKTIRIVQLKTQKTLELPLLTSVGDAIIDYIRNGRPQSRVKRIFITHNYPYDTIRSESFYQIVSDYIRAANIFGSDRRHGPHTLRHSLATALMNNGEQLPVISDILGHSSTESTKGYLTVNIESLLHCSLDVPMVDDAFYIQKGGIFYDRA